MMKLIPKKAFVANLKSYDRRIEKSKESEEVVKFILKEKELFECNFQPVKEVRTSLRRGIIITAEYQDFVIEDIYKTNTDDNLKSLVATTKVLFGEKKDNLKFFELGRDKKIEKLPSVHLCHPRWNKHKLGTDTRISEYTKSVHFVVCHSVFIGIPDENRKGLILLEKHLEEYKNLDK